MKYQSLIHALPNTWKCKLNTDDNSKIDNGSSTFVTINKKYYDPLQILKVKISTGNL